MAVVEQKSREGTRMTAKVTAKLVAGGFAAGVVSGIFGNGGGILVVFLLSSMASRLFEDRREIFSSVTAAVLPMAVVSALIYSSFSPPSLTDTVSVAAASLAGGAVGALLLGKIKPEVLKKIFAAVMIVSGAVMFMRG